MKLFRALLWLLLAGFTALSVHGLWANRLFSQEVWLPSGLARLAGFTALYALIAVSILTGRRALFVPLILGMAAVYSGIAAGFAATGVVLLAVLAAYSLGRIAQVRFVSQDTGAGGLVALMLGFVLFVSVLQWTAWFPVHYAWVYLTLLSVPVAVNWRDNRRAARALLDASAGLGTGECVALALLFYTLALHWLMALKPEISSDGLSMHLVLPAQVAFRHAWPFDFRVFVWAVMPMGGDWAFALAYLPGGEFAARLLNFGFLAATAAMIASALDGRLSRTRSWLVAALFVSTPLVQMEVGNLMVEPFWAAVLMASLLAIDRFDRDGESGWLLVSAGLAGFGLAIKFGSISFSLVMLAVVILRIVRRIPARRARLVAGSAGLFVLFGAWPYVNAWRLTGSPIFPYLNAVLRSPYYEPRSFVDARFRTPLTWNTLYDVTFQSHKYLEGQDGAAGFQWLWLLPLMAVALIGTRHPLARAAMAVALTGWVATFTRQSYLRYIFPALPLLSVVIGLGWRRLREVDPRLSRAAGALLLTVTALNVYFVSSSSWYHKNFLLNPFQPAEPAAYLTEGAPARALVERINRSGEADPRVAFLEDNPIGELRGTAYTNSWHSNVFVWEMRKPTHPVEALELFQRWKITWFIGPKDPSRMRLEYAGRFLAAFTERVSESGDVGLWRLRPEYRKLSHGDAERVYRQNLPAVGTGVYDNSAPPIAFDGPWIHDNQFAEPLNRTVSYCAKKECSIEFRFSGRTLTWIYTGAPNRGIASIEIDGREQQVDLYQPRIEWQRRLPFELTPGPHRVIIRALDRKRPRATGAFVDLDGFEVN